MEKVYTENAIRYLVFKVGSEEYALCISDIQAIIKKEGKISRVPGIPEYIKGVINLRGEIIPVMCFGLMLGSKETEYSEETRIVIIKKDEVSAGLIVDSVSGVVELTDGSIQSINSQEKKRQSDYLTGVVKIDDRVISILNLGEVLKVNK